jgi:heme exporter protein A
MKRAVAAIRLDHVSVVFAIYGASTRSLKNRVLSASTGGRIGTDARNHVTIQALDDVSLTFEHGDRVALIGHNGAGKTTLLRVLAGLLRPHAGSVRVLGRSLPSERWGIRGLVGMLGHEPMLYRELTAEENLRYHAGLHGVDEERVRALLAQLGLDGRRAEPLRTLSRGTVQRVAVARAVLHDPPLLLLDEPHANLDPAARELVAPLIGAASGRTRVVCSHDPERGLADADVVLGLREGRPALAGSADRVTDEQIAELYA